MVHCNVGLKVGPRRGADVEPDAGRACRDVERGQFPHSLRGRTTWKLVTRVYGKRERVPLVAVPSSLVWQVRGEAVAYRRAASSSHQASPGPAHRSRVAQTPEATFANASCRANADPRDQGERSGPTSHLGGTVRQFYAGVGHPARTELGTLHRHAGSAVRCSQMRHTQAHTGHSPSSEGVIAPDLCSIVTVARSNRRDVRCPHCSPLCIHPLAGPFCRAETASRWWPTLRCTATETRSRWSFHSRRSAAALAASAAGRTCASATCMLSLSLEAELWSWLRRGANP